MESPRGLLWKEHPSDLVLAEEPCRIPPEPWYLCPVAHLLRRVVGDVPGVLDLAHQHPFSLNLSTVLAHVCLAMVPFSSWLAGASPAYGVWLWVELSPKGQSWCGMKSGEAGYAIDAAMQRK